MRLYKIFQNGGVLSFVAELFFQRMCCGHLIQVMSMLIAYPRHCIALTVNACLLHSGHPRICLDVRVDFAWITTQVGVIEQNEIWEALHFLCGTKYFSLCRLTYISGSVYQLLCEIVAESRESLLVLYEFCCGKKYIFIIRLLCDVVL